jgi:hypothetical protein
VRREFPFWESRWGCRFEKFLMRSAGTSPVLPHRSKAQRCHFGLWNDAH